MQQKKHTCKLMVCVEVREIVNIPLRARHHGLSQQVGSAVQRPALVLISRFVGVRHTVGKGGRRGFSYPAALALYAASAGGTRTPGRSS
jgi:hypothetical protein